MWRNNIPAVLQRLRTKSLHTLPSARQWSRPTGHKKKEKQAGRSNTKLLKIVEYSTENV